MSNIKVVTISKTAERQFNFGVLTYWRLSLYEFKGDPPKAFFKEDLDVGSYDYPYIYKLAQEKSKEIGVTFVFGITMGDGLDKVFNSVFN